MSWYAFVGIVLALTIIAAILIAIWLERRSRKGRHAIESER